MSNRDLMYVTWLLLGGLVISNIMSQAYFGGTDVDIMNSLMAFRTYNLFGLIPIPLLNISFFTTGLAHLITFDYAFFQGTGVDLVKYVFYVVSVGVVWGIAVAFAGFVFWRNTP